MNEFIIYNYNFAIGRILQVLLQSSCYDLSLAPSDPT